MPEEFYRRGKQIAEQKIRIALNRDRSDKELDGKNSGQLSAFQTRWKYDNRMRGDSKNKKAPSTIDFFQVKIDQRDKYFRNLTMQSQDEVMTQIRQKKPNQNLPYEKLLKRVSQDQQQNLNSVLTGKSALKKNILPNAYASQSNTESIQFNSPIKSKSKGRRNVKINNLNTLVVNDFTASDGGNFSPDRALSPYQYSLQPPRRKTTEPQNGLLENYNI